jgi:predicted deacylase
MPSETDLFPASYEASRARFRASLERVQRQWPAAQCISRPVGPAGDDLTLDWMDAGALETQDKVLVLTVGEHGIEGLVGSAMLELVVEEFLPCLDPRTTGLLLVHAVNPWGMKHRRKVNASNVDLNRNFVWEEKDMNPALNPDYARANHFLNPGSRMGSRAGMLADFFFGLVKVIGGLGMGKFRRAVLLGQYEFPEGIYFGGSAIQAETRLAMELFRAAVATYARILVLDMHTGYGPRSRMSLVNSVHEARSSSVLQDAVVVKSDPDEFYAMQGDMIDFIYILAAKNAPGKHLYATTFEFGTFGDSFGAALRSLLAIISENRLRRFGSADEGLKAHILNEFTELYCPQAADWQAQAIKNARMAFKGILRAEGYLNKSL